MLKGLKGEIDQRPKRFYREVNVAEVEGGWTVSLDGRQLKSPEKRALVLPTVGLAEAVAEEWRVQDERIDIASMFVTRTANVALDRTPAARQEMIAEAVQYASTDLLCYLADGPEKLCDLQDESWAPVRAWVRDAIGVELATVEGISPVDQPEASLERVRAHAEGLGDWRLTGLLFGVGLCGSALLGLAIERGRLSAEEAFELSRVDEAFQESLWGIEAEAERVTNWKRREAVALGKWFAGLGGADL